MNLLNLDSDPEIEKYFDTLTSNKFMPLITCPTRFGKTSKTLIDNIFFNQFSPDIISGNLTVGISDHVPQFALVPYNYPNTVKITNPYKKIRKYKQINLAKFNQDLDSINWAMDPSEDINRYGNNFLNVFNQLIDVHAPLTNIKITKSKIKQNLKPWINKDILKLIKTKDKIHAKYIKESNQAHKQALHNEYKSKKNQITQLIRCSKRDYYNKFFQENNNNIKKLWQGINQIINKTKGNGASPVCIEIDVDGNTKTVTEPKEIANEFNKHYSTVAEKILQKRKYPGNKTFHQYLSKPNPKSFMFKPTSPAEVEDIISKFDTTKSTGPNSIPRQLILSVSKSISTPLANIFNSSLINGICPEFLKLSTVIPIFKKNSKLLVENYRPISLLSNINKILEKIIFKRLYSFLEETNSIYNLQFGFRQRHSTNHALLCMTQQIKDIIDNGNIAIGVFVDFQKAFDTVNHKILLRKLEHYGVRGVTNDWFSSYLSKRSQYVKINGSESKISKIDHGVPQGSVLGPLLFLVYINDLHTCIHHSTVRHFADDTNLLFSTDKSKPRNSNITRNLNKDLKALNHWLLANKISLNSTKTELIYFRNKNTLIPKTKIKLNGVRLMATSDVQYVGLTFDEHLTFNNHIKLLNAKLKRANNLIAVSRHYVPKELLLQIYYGQFYSHLTYGCQLWGQNENRINQTSVLQRKAVRLMTFSHYQAHTNPLFNTLKVLKLTDIVKLNNILFTHNTINNKSPKIFNNFFTLKQSTHQHLTTNNINSAHSIPKGSLDIPTYNTTSGKTSIKYICTIAWNNVLKELSIKHPDKYHSNQNWLKDIKISTFKNLLRGHFLEHYNED